MNATTALSSLTDQPVLDPVAEPLSKAIRTGYESAGPAGQQLKNTLHGVWLKHPSTAPTRSRLSPTHPMSRRAG